VPVVIAGWLVIGAVSLQMVLGASTVWFGLPLAVATAHNGGAALLLLTIINLNHVMSFTGAGWQPKQRLR
jgi:cytochrome c oxidase assembly protein subunit 15